MQVIGELAGTWHRTLVEKGGRPWLRAIELEPGWERRVKMSNVDLPFPGVVLGLVDWCGSRVHVAQSLSRPFVPNVAGRAPIPGRGPGSRVVNIAHNSLIAARSFATRSFLRTLAGVVDRGGILDRLCSRTGLPNVWTLSLVRRRPEWLYARWPPPEAPAIARVLGFALPLSPYARFDAPLVAQHEEGSGHLDRLNAIVLVLLLHAVGAALLGNSPLKLALARYLYNTDKHMLMVDCKAVARRTLNHVFTALHHAVMVPLTLLAVHPTFLGERPLAAPFTPSGAHRQ